MRTLIIIAGVCLVVVATLRIGAAITTHKAAETEPSSGLASSSSALGDTPEERQVEKLEDQQKLLERANDVKEEVKTAPLEQETKVMQQEQKLIDERNDLAEKQIGAQYELEIERLEQERKLLQAQEALKREQEKTAEQEVREQPKIKPITKF